MITSIHTLHIQDVYMYTHDFIYLLRIIIIKQIIYYVKIRFSLYIFFLDIQQIASLKGGYFK